VLNCFEFCPFVAQDSENNRSSRQQNASLGHYFIKFVGLFVTPHVVALIEMTDFTKRLDTALIKELCVHCCASVV